jgi:GNAT superfamily N-acetyltransferase
MDVIVRPVSAAATRPLRLDVLRPGRPPADAAYPGDDDPTTVHFAAVVAEAAEAAGGAPVLGIASLYAEPRPGGPTPAWRLRGMATHPDVRGAGVGAALLTACIDHVAAHGGGELWCNARLPASGFYARFGFEVVGERFEIEGIGPHEVMRRSIAPAPAVAFGDGRP